MKIDVVDAIIDAVAPHVGAWIEILIQPSMQQMRLVAPHVGAWIEIYRHS